MSLQYHPREAVIIFTRYPQPGNVKTRLIPEIGSRNAAHVQKMLTEKLLSAIMPLKYSRAVQFSLYYTGGSEGMMRNWLGDAFFFAKQKGVDLGSRMAAAFRSTWSRGFERAVIIGSDCPSVDFKLLSSALDLLQSHDVVLGPSYDGGYYLLGLNSQLRTEDFNLFFQDIPWGTSEVFRKTFDRAESSGLSIATLTRLHDIDRPEDLQYFHHHTDP